MKSVVTNPLREGLHLAPAPESSTMVIFGAPGDLSRRKLLPSLYDLAYDHLLPPMFSVIGFGRREWSHDEFRSQTKSAVSEFSRRKRVDGDVWKSFADRLFFCPGDFHSREGYDRLARMLIQVEAENAVGSNRVFYLSAPPSACPVIIERLSPVVLATSMSGSRGWKRVIVEKPFGSDIDSARSLNNQIHQVFDEGQIYRIDHYLGKETVQNLLVLRFANGIYEPVWNHNYIDHVQMTASESLGVGTRGGYYEEAGALRDMLQNHMLQLLSLVAMEPPVAFDAADVHDEKEKVLRALRPVKGRDVATCTARGQYKSGWMQGQEVKGYREEEKVRPDSTTETFVAAKLFIDNWRWAGVPFYLRTGKRLVKHATEISIHFKRPPHHLLGDMPGAADLEPNVLTIRIQPNEGVSSTFNAKMPGTSLNMRSVKMDFQYGIGFGVASPSAYETLLLDCLRGDSTLFARHDEVETAWSLVTDILNGWSELPVPDFPNYEAGTWGPSEAEEMLATDGRRWRQS